MIIIDPANPAIKMDSANPTWKLGTLQKGLVLDMPLMAKYHNPATKRFTDQSAYCNHGTGNGTQLGSVDPGFQADRMGQLVRAAPFNGSDDYIDCGNVPSLTFTTEDFTISAWIKRAVLTTNMMIFAKGEYLVSGYELFLSTSNICVFRTYQAAVKQETTSSGLSGTDTWEYVVITRGGVVVKIYLDNTDVTNTSGTHIDPVTSADNAHIGMRSNGAELPFNGNIYDVRIYNRVLSSAERTLLYESYRV